MRANSYSNKFESEKLILLVATIMALLGVVMVASSSVAIAEKQLGISYYFLMRQIIYLTIGFFVATIVSYIPLSFWESSDRSLLGFGFILLALVLVPGIGHEVNGSRRWLQFGPIGLSQVGSLD